MADIYMVKCNNPDCLVPPEGRLKGRNLSEVKAEREHDTESVAALRWVIFSLENYPQI